MNQYPPQNNPYAAPAAHVADAYAYEGDYIELADRGTRLAAQLIDGVCLLIACIPFIFYAVQSSNGQSATMYGMLSAIAVLGLTAYNFALLYQNGQTIGKKVLGIKILRSDGSRAGLRRIFFMRMLPIGLLNNIPFIGVFIALTDSLLIFRDNRLCLHDQIADTIVVKV